jgi:hypothetical protein
MAIVGHAGVTGFLVNFVTEHHGETGQRNLVIRLN